MTQQNVEIEGSAERADDRTQPTGLTFFDAEPDDRLYLGDPVVVDGLVRNFCGEAHSLRGEAGRGTIHASDAMDKLHALCDRYASIFTAPGSEYRAMPFNSVDGLGAFLVDIMGIDATHDQAAKTLFMNTAVQIMAANEAHQTGEMSDEAVRFQIDAAVDDAARALLGIPTTDDGE